MSLTPRALGYAEARARVLSGLTPLAIEHVPVAGSVGRVLRETLHAAHPLPPFRNSAMDGFAVRAADLREATAAAPRTLRVVQVLPAGEVSPRALASGEAARIMTGAPLPEGADAVVPFEDAERGADAAGEVCRIRHAAGAGEHIRAAGADLAAGALALEAGRELSAHDMALALSLGAARLAVSAQPRVAVLSTGDELLPAGAPLRPGAIRDSNRPMLAELVHGAGGVPTLVEHLRDDEALVGERIAAALEASDVVLTIGGVSAGDFDPVKRAIERVGGIELWRVAMRPGRPQAFGRPQGRVFFGLPGNPASVACVFEALVRPALRALQGAAQLDRARVPVRVAEPVESRAGRTDFVRATLAWRAGQLWASPAGAQVSGHLLPQARAHALLVVPEACAQLAAGEAAEALLLRMPDDMA